MYNFTSLRLKNIERNKAKATRRKQQGKSEFRKNLSFFEMHKKNKLPTSSFESQNKYIIYFVMESLILAQNKRWRRA